MLSFEEEDRIDFKSISEVLPEYSQVCEYFKTLNQKSIYSPKPEKSPKRIVRNFNDEIKKSQRVINAESNIYDKENSTRNFIISSSNDTGFFDTRIY